jgi:hypothetical protein
MKRSKNISTTTFIQLIVLAVIIIFICKLIHYTQVQYFTTKKEQFTSGFREMYRPYVRNVRLIGENYYTKIKQTIHLFFRKFGLI